MFFLWGINACITSMLALTPITIQEFSIAYQYHDLISINATLSSLH